MSSRRNQGIKDDAGKMRGSIFLFFAALVIIASIWPKLSNNPIDKPRSGE
jgi:hypothetical protein